VKTLTGNKGNNSAEILTTDSGKISLLGERRKSAGVEMNNINSTEFMDLFDKTNRLFKEINTDFAKLQNEQHKRILPKFNEDENLKISRGINNLVSFITKKIIGCEENIKRISHMSSLSPNESKMRDNIKINLAGKLQEISKKIRSNEEDYMVKFKELGQEETTREPSRDYHQHSKQPHDFLELSLNDNVLQQRDQEINHLVKSIGELSVVFKEMSVLVNEQGTILDRIDYNIEAALENTKQANKHLISTEKIVESGCARNTIMFLIVLIFFEALLLMFKYTK